MTTAAALARVRLRSITHLSRLSLATIVLAAYYVGGRVGLAVPFTSGNVSPVWPPSGIALALILLLGSRVWPAVTLGAFLVNVLSPIPPVAALGISIGNTLGPLAAAAVLRRLRGFRPALVRLRDVIALVVIAALGASAVSATVGTVSLYFTHVNAWKNARSAWLIWWLGDAMGVLVVAPVLLTLPRLFRLRAASLNEGALLVAGAVGSSMLVFGRFLGIHVSYVLALALFPFVLWGAIRFEAAGAAIVTFVICAVAVVDTARGLGPFVHGTALQNATLLQSFLAVIAVSALSVAALITERTGLIREQAESEAVRAGEERYRAIAETASEGVWVLDSNLLTCFVNARMAAMLGYSAFEMLGKPVTAFMFEEDAAIKQAELARRRRGVSEQVENRYRRRDGSELWVRVNTSASTDAAGRFAGALAMISDITAERRREVEARRGRDTILLLSRAVEQTADSVVVTDKQGVIEYVNPAFEQTTGYGWDQAVGRTPAILKSGHHDVEFYRTLWSELLRGRPFRGTLVNRKRTGELYWAEQTITPVTDDEGVITHFVSVLKDVTDLRRRQEHEVQMRLAREVQQRFYKEPPSLDGLDVAAASYPAHETGGDYFDVIPVSGDSAYVAIGDASGHGLASSLVMALTRAYVRSLTAFQLDVGEILTRVNDMLREDLEENRFVTLLLARIHSGARELSYANAGHVPGFILDGRRGVHAVMTSTGPPMGFFAGTQFESCRLALAPRRLVLLVTDGVTESPGGNQDEFGAQRAVEYACVNCERPARSIADGLCAEARRFGGVGGQTDDITSLIVKVEGDQADGSSGRPT